MAKNTMPEKIVGYNVYDEGEKLQGVAGEVEMPELEAIKTTIAGAGILGEIDSSAPGHFSSMQITIPFRTITKAKATLSRNKRHTLTLRAAQESYNITEGVKTYDALKVVIAGMPAGGALGKLGNGVTGDASVVLEVEYLKVELAGEVLFELDKLNGIYVVDGVDEYEAIRRLI